MLGLGFYHRVEIQVGVGNVDCDEAIGLEPLDVALEGLAREQVDRDRAAAEGIEHDQVVPGAVFQLLELESRVADKGALSGRLAVVHVVKPLSRDPDNFRVDLVVVVAIPRAAVGR